METWDYAHCLPYFKRMETCLAADREDPFRGHAGPLVLERGPATNPLFGAFFEAVQQAGYTADRRRERLPPGGVRAVRSQRPRRQAPVGRARLPAPRDEPPEPRGEDAGVRHADPLRGEPRRRASSTRTDAASTARWPARSILCGGAINSPQTLQVSGVGNADELKQLGHRRRRRRPRRGREPPGPPRGLHPVRVHAAGLGRPVHEVAEPAVGRARVAAASARARARRTTSRAAASPAATTTSRIRT